ncbi:MAG: glycosyltransferase family 39 protein [Candidatus Hydrogenedentes bacterium]|nr:glycosyltransferase family 39 protein [Candidatus Hydrogenedentota bacterium]
MTDSERCPALTLPQWFALFAVLAVALTLRVYRIQTEAMWYDEISSYAHLDAPSLREFLTRERVNDAAMLPLYFTVEYFWANAFGGSVLTVRALSLICGMATLVMLYLLGRHVHGHTAGLVAVLCAAFSKLLIYQSQEIRVYALTMLLALVSCYAFLRALESGKRPWWALYLTANALILVTHLFAVLLVAAQGIYLLLTRYRQVRLWLVWGAVHVLFGAMPLLWMLSTDFDALQRHTEWIPIPNIHRLVWAYYFVYAGSKLDAMDLVRHLPWGIPVHHLLGLAMMAAVFWAILHTLKVNLLGPPDAARRFRFSSLVFLLLWLVVPPFSLFVISRLGRPCFIERYAVYSCFPLALLAGTAVASVRRPAVKWTALALLTAILAGNMVDLWRPMRPDWRAAQPVLQHLREANAQVFSPKSDFGPAVIYYADAGKMFLNEGPDYIEAALAHAAQGGNAAIAIVEVPGVYNSADVRAALDRGGTQYAEHHYGGRWDVFIWDLSISEGQPAGALDHLD